MAVAILNVFVYFLVENLEVGFREGCHAALGKVSWVDVNDAWN